MNAVRKRSAGRGPRNLVGLRVAAVGAFAATALSAGVSGAFAAQTPRSRAQYIVEGASRAGAQVAVRHLGGKVLATSSRVHAVLAQLTAGQAGALTSAGWIVARNSSVHVAADAGPSSSTAPTHAPSDVFTQVTGATGLWAKGYNGVGQTVAVLDTGILASLPDFGGRVIDGVDLTGGNSPYTDEFGHGTFVAGLIASNGASSGGEYMGEAPDANLVSIKVAGGDGVTSEWTVIQGINWAIAHRRQDGISVLNISLGVKPPGPASADPLDLACELAWHAGIVVVTPAGNFGPDNGTITSPGDDPLVVTVGALDDGASTNPANFSMASFSGVGPTMYGGLYKPDIVASGRSVVSLADPGSTIYTNYPSAMVGASNFVGSGTSFSTAITSGMAALVQEANPGISPDDVKARLLLTASPGPTGDPLVDGHGVANAYNAAGAQSIHLLQPTARQSAAVSNGSDSGVNLAKSWAISSWDPALWNGAAWNGAAWNGAAWNGAAWNGAAWNGAAWNGAAWKGAAWNGAAWNGSAWNGVTFDGAAWNGAAWNGAAWNGAAWNGAAWNGAAWNGAAWNGAAWNGAAWNGAIWNGAAWNGAAWNGAIWNGAAWNGAAWNGAAWNGAAWNGAGWNGAAWNAWSA